ncbi:hypothetical protein C8Q79DRAFT_1013662 [Trametes meyenii]|nr:hypothetical protein C8Q79DRAFT_1013662 [Trametes meyenii]
MRTRPGLKSCLKITPPITPDLSAASSPCGSGRTSPSVASDGGLSTGSGGRKTVQFSDNELEEVFWADEWDRTPAAVTPKLSYHDILELKQLRISLPYSPPPPPPRQPFTTSSPSAGPSNKPPFPVSRFASGPSYTPSKWKNRSQPRQDVDPEILPYLDAVPIRLLPLLPQSPPPDPPPSEPHPQTPTPTASPEARPAPPPPSEPPEIRIEPVAPPPTSPPSPVRTRKTNFAFVPLLPVQDPPPVLPPPVSSPTTPVRPKRTLNMTFLPVNAAPDSDSSAPAHAASGTPPEDARVGTSSSAPLPPSSSSVSWGDPKLHDPTELAPSTPPSSSAITPTPSTAQPLTSMSPPPLSLSLPMFSTQSSGMESDNDTEADTTDTYVSDTDAESDAPSTSTYGSSLPSPPLDDDLEVEARLEELKLGTSDLEHDYTGHAPRIHTQDPGSYFPPVPLPDAVPLPIPIPAHAQVEDDAPALPNGPGQTPPLSVLYPSPTSQHQHLLPLDAISSASVVDAVPPVPSSHPQPPAASSGFEDAQMEIGLPPGPIPPSLSLSLSTTLGEDSLPSTPLSMSRVLRKKLTLEALPSPALVPPSPFELDPMDALHTSPSPAPPAAESLQGATAIPEMADVQYAVASGQIGRVAQRLAALGASDGSPPTPLAGAATKSLVETPDDSPLLTLESMRAAWDAGARVGLGVGVEARTLLGPSGALAPSLSRRRSS